MSKKQLQLDEKINKAASLVRKAGFSVHDPGYRTVRHIMEKGTTEQMGAIVQSSNDPQKVHVYFDI